MTKSTKQQLEEFLNFLANAPEDQEIIAMDCNEHCEQLAVLAERVARGEDLAAILPELQQHMRYWRDCREEFWALVAIIKAELANESSTNTDSL